MQLEDLQSNMRQAYMGGGPGVLVSAATWLVAGALTFYFNETTGIIAFFIGGIFIIPIGIFIAKLFNRSGNDTKGNTLAILSFECTAILFIGLFISYIVFLLKTEWFFTIMLMIVGARYFIFQTIYGMKIYWLIAIAMVITGFFSLFLEIPLYLVALLGGGIELIFATIIMGKEKSNK